MNRVEVTFPNGETHGYTFTEQRWFDHFVNGWKAKGYKVEEREKS